MQHIHTWLERNGVTTGNRTSHSMTAEVGSPVTYDLDVKKMDGWNVDLTVAGSHSFAHGYYEMYFVESDK